MESSDQLQILSDANEDIRTLGCVLNEGNERLEGAAALSHVSTGKHRRAVHTRLQPFFLLLTSPSFCFVLATVDGISLQVEFHFSCQIELILQCPSCLSALLHRTDSQLRSVLSPANIYFPRLCLLL